jgi:hypothetical protein
MSQAGHRVSDLHCTKILRAPGRGPTGRWPMRSPAAVLGWFERRMQRRPLGAGIPHKRKGFETGNNTNQRRREVSSASQNYMWDWSLTRVLQNGGFVSINPSVSRKNFSHFLLVPHYIQQRGFCCHYERGPRSRVEFDETAARCNIQSLRRAWKCPKYLRRLEEGIAECLEFLARWRVHSRTATVV